MMDRLFSFDARITRLRLLTAFLLALPLAWVAVLLLRTGRPATVITVGATAGAVVAKLLVEAVRRRHDMGASGNAVLGLFVGGAALIFSASIYSLGTGSFKIFYAAMLLVACGWAALLLRPGQASVNRYGSVPVALLPAFGERHGRYDLAIALFLTALGATAGFAGTRWTAAMREHHADVLRQTEQLDTTINNNSPDELENLYGKSNAR